MKASLGTRTSFPVLFNLPVSVDLQTAATSFGMSMGTAYRLVHAHRFPCRVLRPGWRYIVRTSDLMDALGIDTAAVHGEDVLAGWADDEHDTQEFSETEDQA